MILTRLWQRVLSGRQFQSEKDYAQDLGSSSGVKMWWVSWSQAASAYRKCWHTVKANIIRPPCFHSCLFIFMPGTTMVNHMTNRQKRKHGMTKRTVFASEGHSYWCKNCSVFGHFQESHGKMSRYRNVHSTLMRDFGSHHYIGTKETYSWNRHLKP